MKAILTEPDRQVVLMGLTKLACARPDLVSHIEEVAKKLHFYRMSDFHPPTPPKADEKRYLVLQ